MTLAAIVIGVVSLILTAGFVKDIYVQLAEALIRSQSGHLQISRPGFLDEGTRKPDQFLIEDPQPVRQQVEAMAGVDDVMARISFSGLLGNGRTELAVVGEGIEPDREARLGTYLRIKAGRRLADEDRHGALVGDGVATTLGLKPGDPVTLLVSTADGALNSIELDVVGVFQSFSKDFDARAVRIPLEDAQSALDTAGVNTIVVALKDTASTGQYAALLRGQLDRGRFDVKAWNELSDFYEKTVDLYDRQFGVLRLIILLMVLLSVANSVNMTAMERVGEFGTMMALGNRRRQTFALLVAEGATLGLIGSALGVALGIALAIGISAIGIPMPPPPNSDLAYTAQIRIVPSEIALAFVIGLTATVAASVLPAWRATRTPLVDALRQNA